MRHGTLQPFTQDLPFPCSFNRQSPSQESLPSLGEMLTMYRRGRYAP